MKQRQRAGVYVAALCVLLGVFSLYTRPDFLFTLANQIWACF
jgi:hypothetical protein